MSWHPNDLVTDQDLVDYEQTILTQFGQTDWLSRRTKALEDWLWPILRAQGFEPSAFKTRFEPDQVWTVTGGVYTDVTGSAKDASEDDLNLATIFATPGTDAIYVGSTAPFRGLHWRMLDSISAIAGTVTVAYWNDAWTPIPTVTDGTQKSNGVPFSGGGSMTWALVPDWTVRTINKSNPFYWVKVTVTASPTSAKATQIGVIRRSVLCAPSTFRTLMLIFREAPTGQDGPWDKKAQYYSDEADLALQRAIPVCGGEFETKVPTTDLVSATEAQQATEVAANRSAFTLERG